MTIEIEHDGIRVTVLRTDGRSELHEIVPKRAVLPSIGEMIGAATIEVVNLRDGRVMLINEDGYEVEIVQHAPRDGYDFVVERRPTRALLPVNARATALYHTVCPPGTTHAIVGDVAIILYKDFADDEDDDEAEAP